MASRLRGVEIIAHRGASYDAPENTLSAARLAWMQGADALEMDVHLTGDGRLAVIHDEDLQRVAGVARKVSAATLAELKEADVGRWKGAAFAGERIPELGEVLATVPAGRRVFIEIKSGAGVVGALERCLAQHGPPPGRAVIISFDRQAARAAKQALPRFEVCLVVDTAADMSAGAIDSLLDACGELGLDGLDFPARWPLDDRAVEAVHQRGGKVYVWTVDDVRTARRLEAAGVDGITTNRPGWLRAQLAAEA